MTIKQITSIFMLVGVLCGCDEADIQVDELDVPDAYIELDEYGGATEIAPPPASSTCDQGYWDQAVWNYDCGSCTHTLPDPDRPGRLMIQAIRWCEIGIGCGCHPWQIMGVQCNDGCGG